MQQPWYDLCFAHLLFARLGIVLRLCQVEDCFSDDTEFDEDEFAQESPSSDAEGDESDKASASWNP